MKSAEELNALKLALRQHLCAGCPVRSMDDTPSPQASACESDCALFVNLPRLARLVKEGEPPCGYAIFQKSLEGYSGKTRGTDVVQALAILESAIAELSATQCGDTGGCERLTRITTAVACLHAQPKEETSDKETKANQ